MWLTRSPTILTLEERDSDIHGTEGWALTADMDGEVHILTIVL